MAVLPTVSYFQTLFLEVLLIPLVWISPFTLVMFGILYAIAYYIANAGYWLIYLTNIICLF